MVCVLALQKPVGLQAEMQLLHLFFPFDYSYLFQRLLNNVKRSLKVHVDYRPWIAYCPQADYCDQIFFSKTDLYKPIFHLYSNQSMKNT